jgi:NAD(P)-dependent dehydrogenase (short-subunit alcohol dehydrogenase family)
MDVRGRVAIVTGSATGIGRATAIALAREGARAVVLADLATSELEQTAESVRAEGAEGLPLRVDVSDLASLRDLFTETLRRFGGLDILHNNAGLGEGQSVWPDVDPDRCRAIVDVNLTGVILGTQLALAPMQAGGGGVVVNTSSGGAFIPVPQQAVYAATKAGVVHFTRSCEPLFASHGVRVNCVCPGLVDTPMMRGTGDGVTVADWLRPIHDGVMLLQPEDIAAAVLDLVRDDAKVAEIVTVENQPRG